MMKYIISRCLVLVSIFTTTLSHAQLQINPNGAITPEQAVQDILIGAGINAFNVTFNGSAANALISTPSVLEFNSGATGFPISSGVLMQTMNAPSVLNDADLVTLSGQSVTNGVVIEFDFIPTGDTLSFNYIFASSEYTSYTCSSFNDVFGFFISGPGISGPYTNGAVNLATVPGTTIPVAINTVNSGSAGWNDPAYCAAADPNWQANSVYFTLSYNPIISSTPNVAAFNGGTIVLSANSDLVCNQVYHIKLAIANAVDQALDSGVFLEANSFASEAIEVAVATVSGDTTVIEGCTTAELMFIRPQSQLADTMTVSYTIGGTAIMGTDYNNLINPVQFLPGEDTLVLTIDPTFDGISDNGEYVTITVVTINNCGDTIISTGTLWIIDSVQIDIDHIDPIAYCVDDSVMVTVSASGGAIPYTYSWSDGQSGDTVYLPTPFGTTSGSVDYIVTATDDCGYTGTDTVTVTINQTLAIDTLIQYPASACVPDGAVSAFVSGLTGVPLYNWNGPGASNPNFFNATVWQNLSSGWFYFTVTDNVCSVSDSIFLEMDNPPIAQLSPVNNSGCSPVVVNFTNSSQNAVTYTWDMGGGNVYTVSTTASQQASFTENTMVMLVAADANDCKDTTYAFVTVVLCGCTDQNATNYDPTAIQDDGSCLYPEPIIVAPNVFTPNGDNDNDVFELQSEYAILIELTIHNRWGNVLFNDSGLNPVWNGKTKGGENAEDGTYFYTYKATGIDGTTIEGHGFFNLFR